MGDHWPLAVSGGLIALAAMLGLWQHDHAVEVATQGSQLAHYTAPVTAPQTAPAPVEADVAPVQVQVRPVEAAPVTTRTPIVNPFAPAAQAPTAQVALPLTPAAPIATAPTPPNPAAQPNQAVAQLAPGAVAPAATPGPRHNRATALADLRTDLQKKLNLAPTDVAGGGFLINTDGGRLELTLQPKWAISIYNLSPNPKTPEVETPKFKEMLDAVVASLQIDMTTKPVESANGKSYLKTNSKLGNISMIRDPANGNSCVISGLEKWVPPAPAPVPVGAVPQPGAAPQPVVNAQPGVAPAQPVVPGAEAPVKKIKPAPAVPKAPVAPPRPPGNDANF